MIKDKAKYRILVIEDNPGDFFLIEDYILEEIQMPEIVHCESFSSFKTLFQKSSDFDIILLDLTLPDMQGEELIHRVVEIAKHQPVIVLTGYPNMEFAIKALSLGASDYLLKDNLSAPILYKSMKYNTERFSHLQKIRESEQLYADLFHLSPQPMWVYDLETLQFIDVNQAAINHYGYSQQEFLSMTLYDIRPESEFPILNQRLKNKNTTVSVKASGQSIHKKKDGSLIEVDLRGSVLRYRGRKAEMVVSTDITEQLEHLRAIENQNKKLREIAWTQSHLVRSPLAKIMGLIELFNLKEAATDPSEILELIRESARELDEVIHKIVETASEKDSDSEYI